eukprot:3780624-Pleurochrysis_carterae.AAC.2
METILEAHEVISSGALLEHLSTCSQLSCHTRGNVNKEAHRRDCNLPRDLLAAAVVLVLPEENWARPRLTACRLVGLRPHPLPRPQLARAGARSEPRGRGAAAARDRP